DRGAGDAAHPHTGVISRRGVLRGVRRIGATLTSPRKARTEHHVGNSPRGLLVSTDLRTPSFIPNTTVCRRTHADWNQTRQNARRGEAGSAQADRASAL